MYFSFRSQLSWSPADLGEDGLRLALVSGVARVASADAGAVVTKSTSRAIAATLGTLSIERIGSGWALNQTAVGTTESVVALASVLVLGIPGRVVLCRDVAVTLCGGRGEGVVVPCEFQERLADTMSRALIRAGRAAAALSPEAIEAFALASLPVASSLSRALEQLSVVVGSLGSCAPCAALCASPHRAVSTCPCGNVRVSTAVVRLAARVALAGVFGRTLALSMPGACVGAVRLGASHHGEENNRDLQFRHCAGSSSLSFVT